MNRVLALVVTAIAVARGARYFALGLLAIYFGDSALELMRTRGAEVAMWRWSTTPHQQHPYKKPARPVHSQPILGRARRQRVR